MSNIMIASAAPIFWCWHAFVDHIYWNWQLCQVSCPDVVGYPLGVAKLKIKCAGLKTGCVTRLPRYVFPPDRVPAPYPPPPDPVSLSSRFEAGASPGSSSARNSGRIARISARRAAETSRAARPTADRVNRGQENHQVLKESRLPAGNMPMSARSVVDLVVVSD